MQVLTTDFKNAIGYDYTNSERPFYLLEAVIAIIVDDNKKKTYLRLEKGYTSDGCTLKKCFWLLLGCPHTPKYLPASILHDWLVEHPETIKRNRNFSSKAFKQMLIQCNVGKAKAYIMYLAVEAWQAFSNIWRHKWN